MICHKLQKLTIVDREGVSVPLQQCIEQRAPTFGQPVTPEVCAGCNFRSAAPPKPERVKREPKPASAAKMLDCEDRKHIVIVKCCGEVTHKYRCQSELSGVKGQVVTAETCNNCPARREVASKK